MQFSKDPEGAGNLWGLIFKDIWTRKGTGPEWDFQKYLSKCLVTSDFNRS